MSLSESVRGIGVEPFDHRRLLESIGNVPPAEYERAYYRLNESQPMAA